MADNNRVTGEDLSSRELVTTRIFNAPRERVFQVWTDPKSIPHWWGPNGFSSTIHEYDLRPGGDWKLTMHGPDGTDYPNHLVFVEITPPSRLMFDHVSAPLFRSTVTFDDVKGRTKVTMRMLFRSAEELVAVSRVAVEGNEQLLDRLNEELNKLGK
jgi:uncharacterized protein YndB with AHSA1/START domain